MSDDGTKDWANIRIEEPVRDDARDDPRTYTEIMRAGLRAREGEPTTEDIMEAFGIPDGVIPDDFDARLGRIEASTTDGIPEDLRDQLDRIESAASTAEERTGSIENTLENMGGR